MSQEPAIPPPTSLLDWKGIHAFGLPSGSVRALLAMLIFAATWGLLLMRPTEEIPPYLRDLLFIIMGHYFASRKAATAVPHPGPGPLFLPNGSVRVVLVLMSLAVAVSLYVRGQLTTPARHPGVVTLLLVAGFLLGVMASSLFRLVFGSRQTPPRWFEDLRAVVAMLAALALVFLIANRVFEFVSQPQIDRWLDGISRFGKFGPENLLAATVGFYFGSRS